VSRFILLLLICFLIPPCYAQAFFAKNNSDQVDETIVQVQDLKGSKKGYRVLGDMSILEKQYPLSRIYFEKILPYGVQSEHSTQQLAKLPRGQKKLAATEKFYKSILMQDADNVDAKMELGYVEINKRNFKDAKDYFTQVLVQDPSNKDARMGVTYSYLGNEERLKALEELDKLSNDDEVALTRAQTYYDMGMTSDSIKALKGVVDKDAAALRDKIRHDNLITITPSYSFLIQTLAENFKLDVNKFGTNVSQNIDNNLTVFTEYNIYVYSSGQFGVMGENQLNNVTNELRGGVYGRPREKVEIKADFGAKFFEFGDGMLITDSAIKYYFNDFFNLKLGVKRNNVEQSYLSAVGFPLDGVFTGRVADNKLYLEYDSKLPKNLYSFGRTGVGLMTGQNLNTNPYAEAMVGVGKIIYNKPENKLVKTVNLDFVSYNAGYKENLLRIPNQAGEVFGGYFSPSFFTANTVNLKAEGRTKKLRYGFKGFAGCQVSMTPDQTSLVWSVSPYAAYDLNDHITFNAAYVYFNFADVQRNLFMVNAVIRGPGKAKR